MSKMRWGVLSTAKIGTEKVIPAIQSSEHGDVVAIASRDQATAESAGAALGIERSYGSYEALLDDPDVDAIYNPLPNHLHIPWTKAAVEAGKHVLCEKPLGLDRQEVIDLVGFLGDHPDLVVMEAFMYRFHPHWQKVREIVRSGELGALRHIQTFFSYRDTSPTNIRQVPEWGGGGLRDIGCYPISQARWLFGAEPDRVVSHLVHHPEYRVDHFASAILQFGDRTASFTVSMDIDWWQRAHLYFDHGRVEIEFPVNAPADRAVSIWVTSADGTDELTFGPADQYGLQADAFATAVAAGTGAPTPLADAVANMAVIDAVDASASSGQWVVPAASV